MTTFNEIQKNLDKVEKNFTDERNERCEPVAKQIIKLIAENNGPLIITAENRLEFVKEYDGLITKVVDLLRETQLPLEEWGYVMRLARVPFDHVDNYVATTIEKNMSEAMEFYWGKKENEVTLEDLALKKQSMVK